MAITRTRLRQLHREELRRVRPLDRSGPRSADPRPVGPSAVGGRLAGVLGGAWVAVLALALAVEPAPASGSTSEPVWAGVLAVAMVAALTATAVGLAGRQRTGLLASLAAAGLGLVGAVLCPASGHHASVGAWWYLQMGGFAALAALSVAGLRAAATPRS